MDEETEIQPVIEQEQGEVEEKSVTWKEPPVEEPVKKQNWFAENRWFLAVAVVILGILLYYFRDKLSFTKAPPVVVSEQLS